MKVENGHNVKVHYKGTLTDGTEFDNSKTRGQTLDFEVGSPRLIQGFSNALLGMAKGETKTVSLPAESAYGPVRGNGPQGPFMAKIHEIQDSNVILDFNHPLAGKDLNFEIELVELEK